jgi:hypothetical protein
MTACLIYFRLSRLSFLSSVICLPMLLRFSIRKFFMLARATSGLIVLVVCFILQLSCNHSCHCKLGRQTAAVQSLRTIHNAQAEYLKIHNRLGTLNQLATAGLIGERYANGQPVSGYIYSEADISAETYCVQATRVNHRKWLPILWPLTESENHQTAYRDFIICEDGTIRSRESVTPQPLKRCEGAPISEFPPPGFQDPCISPTP